MGPLEALGPRLLGGLVVGSVGGWSGSGLGVPWLIEVGGFNLLVLCFGGAGGTCSLVHSVP